MKLKPLVIGSIIACMSLFSFEVVRAYKKYVPVAREGKCVEITVDNYPVTLNILKNNISQGSALVLSYDFMVVVDVTYIELRQLNVKGVECP